jgi:hypothetical protein
MATDPLPLDFGSDKPFYVYLYRDPRRGKKRQPIYVGKGTVKHGRAEGDHNHNILLVRLLNKIMTAGLEPIIEVVAWFDSENDALALERRLIKRIGRRDLGKGPLANLTDGGDGPLGLGENARMVMSSKSRARWQEPEYAAKILAAQKALWQDFAPN